MNKSMQTKGLLGGVHSAYSSFEPAGMYGLVAGVPMNSKQYVMPYKACKRVVPKDKQGGKKQYMLPYKAHKSVVLA